MIRILNIETAGEVCSVCLSINGKPEYVKESHEGRSHASELTVLIEQLMQEAEITTQQLDAIAVSQGPGSYTGLRIGVSVAKGICYAAQKPLIAISTLQSLAYGFFLVRNDILKGDLLCPMIDARRMEVYKAFYNVNGQIQGEITADIIDDNSYMEELEQHRIWFFGSGAAKCRQVLTHHNAKVYGDFSASASYMASLSYNHFQENKFVDVAYFEPFYLKEFVASLPKNKIF
jgi:tRNA threonylcarbamoyladenosine biosynthesis protein TsaB